MSDGLVVWLRRSESVPRWSRAVRGTPGLRRQTRQTPRPLLIQPFMLTRRPRRHGLEGLVRWAVPPRWRRRVLAAIRGHPRSRRTRART